MHFLTMSSILLAAALTSNGFAGQTTAPVAKPETPQSSIVQLKTAQRQKSQPPTNQIRGEQISGQSPFAVAKAKIGPADQVIVADPQNNRSPESIQPRTFDKGIYAPTYADGYSMCAAIMSYNFTQGENPTLKDVTTCTPARPNTVYRTHDRNTRQPPAPSMQKISMPQSHSNSQENSGK